MKTGHLNGITASDFYSGTDTLTKSVEVFSHMFLQDRDEKRALFIHLSYSPMSTNNSLQVLIQGSGSSHWELYAPLIAHVRSKPAHGSAYFPLLSI